MNDINDILAKHFSGEISPEEKVVLEEWMENNPTEYAILKNSWENPGLDIPNFNTKNAWNKVETNLDTPVKKLNPRFYWVGAAASIVLIVASVFFFNRRQEILIANNTGEVMEHVMPDGSHVWLAKNAEIAYNDNFESERNLVLSGTAFFEVERDESHPFKVNHAFGEVEVLGTGFNVEVTENSATVMVDHGLVALRNKAGKEVLINPNETAIANNSEDLATPDVTDKNTLSWKTGKFVFEDEVIVNVIEDLNAHYSKEITLKEGTYIPDVPRLTATFENQTVDEVIEIIVLTCGLDADYQDEVIVLSNQ